MQTVSTPLTDQRTSIKRLGHKPGRRQLLSPPGCLKCATRQLQQLIVDIRLPNQQIHTGPGTSHLPLDTQHDLAYEISQLRPGQDDQLDRLHCRNVQQLQPAYAGAVVDNSAYHISPQDKLWFAVQQDRAPHSSSTSSSGGSSSSSSGNLSDSAAAISVHNTDSSREALDLPPISDMLQKPSSPSWCVQQQQQQTQTSAESSSNTADSEVDSAVQQQQEDSLGVKAALAMLRWYKSVLSPMMQSTCRFLPTCSQYSMDSYRRYGVAKGTVLTAWRLLRCNPLGPSGYDPTQWPPPGLSWLFQYSYSAEVAVVVGTTVFIRLGHALLFE